MAEIRVLKNEELVGGTSNVDVYPITHTKAVYDSNNKQLDARLNDNDSDRELLHRESEKVVAYITTEPKNGTTVEITGNANNVTITGYGKIENFGDEPYRDVSVDNVNNYHSTTLLEKSIQGNSAVSTFTLPDTVGSYEFTTEATDGAEIINKASSTVYVNLRKYVGFADDTPTDVTKLAYSAFSNSVAISDFEVPAVQGASPETYKYIYFAVPSGMTINKVTQTTTGYDFAVTLVGTVNRTINNKEYPYKIYRSVSKPDSSQPKPLRID